MKRKLEVKFILTTNGSTFYRSCENEHQKIYKPPEKGGSEGHIEDNLITFAENRGLKIG